MRHHGQTATLYTLLLGGTSLLVSAASAVAQDPAQESVPAQVIVTVKPRKAAAVRLLVPDDFKVLLGRRQVPATGAVPVVGGSEGLELLIAIDDAASPGLLPYLPEIRHFLETQPPATSIGIAWLHPAGAEIAVPPTTDRKRAAGALVAPHNAVTRPYFLLSELIRAWPPCAASREIVLLTTGADPSAGGGVSNRSLDVAIHDAQRAGIVVHGITLEMGTAVQKAVASGPLADAYLGRLADETGGAFYRTGAPLTPHFSDLSRRLAQQYRVTFPAMPDKKPFVPLKITAAAPDVQIVAAPARVYVAAPHIEK